MENRQAAATLETIRTLMERSALYRRALGPIMFAAGLIGVVGSTIPCFVTVTTGRAFAIYWAAVSVAAMGISLLLVRRQALRDNEPIWSPPTRRVIRSLAPSFGVGFLLGLFFSVQEAGSTEGTWLLSAAWMICYGCALHAAGFYTVQGIRWFGWLFVVGGFGYFWLSYRQEAWQSSVAAHYAMGIAFGISHLAYGAYLFVTEKTRKSA